MKRLLIAVFASLLAVAMIGPASAQGTTKYRYWQDLSVSGPFSGQIVVTIAYEDRHGNRKFTPRYAAAYQLQAQTSCDPGSFQRDIGGNAFSKYGYFKGPLVGGRFAHRFENQFEQPSTAPIKGDLTGRVLPRVERGDRVIRTARVQGAFDIEHWSPQPGVAECISSGTYSATPCTRGRSKRDRPHTESKAPVCSVDPW